MSTVMPTTPGVLEVLPFTSRQPSFHPPLVVYGLTELWVFTDGAFTPSPWLLLFRQSRAMPRVDHLRYDSLALAGRPPLSGVYRHFFGDGATPHTSGWSALTDLNRLQNALDSGTIRLYRLNRRLHESRLHNPQDPLWVDPPQHLYDAANLDDNRSALIHELGLTLLARWHARDLDNGAFYAASWSEQRLIEIKASFAAARTGVQEGVTSLKHLPQELKALGSAALTLAADVGRVELDILEKIGHVVTLDTEAMAKDVEALNREFVALGIRTIKNTQELIALLKKGRDMWNLVYTDPLVRDALLSYLVGYTQSIGHMTELKADSKFAGRVVFEVLLFVAGGEVIDAVKAGVMATRAGMAGRGAAAAAAEASRFIGPFTKRALGYVTKLADLMQARKLKAAQEAEAARLAKAPASQGAPARAAESEAAATKEAEANGGKNKNGEGCSANSKTCQGGEPISLVTGEELLSRNDFTLAGLLPLTWARHYRTSNPDDIGLGYGWTHPLSERLTITGDRTYYEDAEGRLIPFITPTMGGESSNRSEQLTLCCPAPNRYVIRASQGGRIAHHFAQVGDAYRLTQIRDSAGNHLDLHYPDGVLTQVTSGMGEALRFEYTDDARIKAVHKHTADGETTCLVRYEYDAQHDLVAAYDEVGACERYEYVNHVITKRTLKSGYSFHFEWDQYTSKARCLRNWGDPIDGEPTYDYRFEWDPTNKTNSVIDTRGGRQTYQFNDLGLPVYHRDAEGGETRYAYDADGKLIQITDVLGHSERFTYNQRGLLQTRVDKNGHRHQYRYSVNGQPVSYTDPQGHVWQRQYNEHGQQIASLNPLGEATRYQYNALGLINGVTDPLGRHTRYVWDNKGQLTAIRDAMGQHTRYRYDGQGRLSEKVRPDNQRLRYEYDVRGRCTAVIQPDGTKRQYQYNSLDLLEQITDESGKPTRYEYNGLSQVTRRIDPLGEVLRYHYDGERNLIGLTNESGERYRLRYDLNERLIEEIGFDQRRQQYHYNLAGHLIEQREMGKKGALLTQTQFERDPMGRLLGSDSGDSSTRFSYDPIGQLTAADNAHRKLRWQYDPVGRLLEDWQDEAKIEHRYDAAGQRIKTTLPDGQMLRFEYDDIGGFTGLYRNDQLIANVGRDLAGREINKRYGNHLETHSDYDPQGRLIAQRTIKLAGDAVANHPTVDPFAIRNYQYDARGRLTGIDDNRRGGIRYHYDAMDRLTQVDGPTPEALLHDPANNVLAMAANRDDADAEALSTKVQGNRLLFQGDTHYRYDQRGNRIEAARGKNKKLKTRYVYNNRNQLTDVVKNDDQYVTFQYDALGRRINKTLEGKYTTRYLWNGDVLLQETRTEKAATEVEQEIALPARTYLYQPDTFKPLALVEQDKIFYYHLDHLGTPLELSNEHGEMVWAVSYKSYGNLAIKHEAQIEQPIRFQGQYYDEETGLHYNRYRYYDPGIGQFITQDPIGLKGGINSYQYVPNPTGWVDPLGLTAKEIASVCPKSLPKGIDYDGTVYRFENPDRINTTWDTHQWNKAANHRYTEPGRSGVYGATSANTAHAEISHYGALQGRELVSKQVHVENVLDLTSPQVREQLGVSLEDITAGNSYDVTHQLGRFAQDNGYGGILAPSARDSAGSNLISFSGL
ncbi:MAG: RHS domain-containing protein [Gammaproteobacteria bacterium]|nr:RHS domain-containing protein [Gammaproteobacteria bacterium]